MRSAPYILAMAVLMAACDQATSPTEPSTSASPAPSGEDNGQRTIAATHYFGASPDKTTVAGPVNSVVGPGVELTNFGVAAFVNGQQLSGFVDVDFSSSNIRIRLTRDQTFAYFDSLRFQNVAGTQGVFSRATLNPGTDYRGFTASRMRIEADMVELNLTGLSGLRGQQILLDLALASR